MENEKYRKFIQAQRWVAQIKGFYSHAAIFVVFNAALLLTKNKMIVALFGEAALGHTRAMDWVYWNILIWAIILAVHAIFVFGKVPFFIKKWEERKIEKYMNQDTN